MNNCNYSGKDFSRIDKNYDSVLYLKAKKVRKYVAQKLSRTYIFTETEESKVRQSMLNAVLERHPFPNTEKTLDFNVHVTSQACKELLDNADATTDLVELTGLYAYVIEIGSREFIDPNNVDIQYKHLGSAKDFGFFFTPPSMAIRMIQASMVHNPTASIAFDPAMGSGVLLAYNLILNPSINKVVGVEIDRQTAMLAQHLLTKICQLIKRNVVLDISCQDFFDFFDLSFGKRKFDSIIMNPPYGSVKFLSSDLTDLSTKAVLDSNKLKNLKEKIRQNTLHRSKILREKLTPYGMAKGTLEYSKLFMACSMEMLSDSGTIVAITPSSWLGDDTSYSFRQSIIPKGQLHELWLIPETAKLFKGVNQPTAVSILGKNRVETVSLSNLTDGEVLEKIQLSINCIIAVSGKKLKFPLCNSDATEILLKLQKKGKLKEIADLANSRGELDLTKYKEFITTHNTGHRLIRGDHIRGGKIILASESNKEGYVKYEKFLSAIGKSPKLKFIFSSRIAIPQCSYLQKRKRLVAAIVPKGSVLANSCNFIAVLSDIDRQQKEFYYWIYLNSWFAEWQFRIFSYNNHVANSELSELICVPYEDLDEVQKGTVRNLMVRNNDSSVADAFIAITLGLSKGEYHKILKDLNVENMEKYLQAYDTVTQKPITNHQLPSLSSLDKLMISYVEPGGNWTSIPESVPSKRLAQIREMAKTRGMVRTTYYSRLKYNQPAYTISTYFNRPGNGANIHPWEDRTLSCREAARLQSFPDSFVFKGTESSVRTQIGNAVPPLLGYAIAKAIFKRVNKKLHFCDVFAGAGGLSFGMEMAGFSGLAAIELNSSAAETYSANHSSYTKMFMGDINDFHIRGMFEKYINDNVSPDEPWVMVGGPPCQGFSTAGYRNENDIRNKLVDSYLDLIEHVKPTIVVMENVQGILSMKGGKVIEGVYLALGKLGYKLIPSPWILDAEMFGVPQMRRRVIIVAAKTEKYLPEKPTALFAKCLGRRESQNGQTALTHIAYPITVGEALLGLPALLPVNNYYPKDVTIDPTYSMWCEGKISVESFLNKRSNN